jgi:hypothetical protein
MFVLVVVISACSVAARNQSEGCLTYVEDRSTTNVEIFDSENDVVDGQHLSCQLLTTASQIRRGMARIAAALRANDIDALATMSLPLLFINDENVKIDIRTIEDLREWYTIIFDEPTRRKLIDAEMGDLSIARNEGASLGNGWVWYVVAEIGGPARLSTINHSVLSH